MRGPRSVEFGGRNANRALLRYLNYVAVARVEEAQELRAIDIDADLAH